MKLWRKMGNKTTILAGDKESIVVTGRMYKRLHQTQTVRLASKLVQSLLSKLPVYTYPKSDREVRFEKLKSLFNNIGE
jgi:hypothetical protein